MQRRPRSNVRMHTSMSRAAPLMRTVRPRVREGARECRGRRAYSLEFTSDFEGVLCYASHRRSRSVASKCCRKRMSRRLGGMQEDARSNKTLDRSAVCKSPTACSGCIGLQPRTRSARSLDRLTRHRRGTARLAEMQPPLSLSVYF
jgi:hypothetical protein